MSLLSEFVADENGHIHNLEHTRLLLEVSLKINRLAVKALEKNKHTDCNPMTGFSPSFLLLAEMEGIVQKGKDTYEKILRK